MRCATELVPNSFDIGSYINECYKYQSLVAEKQARLCSCTDIYTGMYLLVTGLPGLHSTTRRTFVLSVAVTFVLPFPQALGHYQIIKQSLNSFIVK